MGWIDIRNMLKTIATLRALYLSNGKVDNNNPSTRDTIIIVEREFKILEEKYLHLSWFVLHPLKRAIVHATCFAAGYMVNSIWRKKETKLENTAQSSVETQTISHSKFTKNCVSAATISWFRLALKQSIISSVESLPEIFAGSVEFSSLGEPATPEHVERLLEIFRPQIQEPKHKTDLMNVHRTLLMHSHLTRKTNILSESQRSDLKNMLMHSDGLVEAMLSVCRDKGWINSALNSIRFGQHIAQAIWINDSTLLQLPHFTNVDVKLCQNSNTALQATTLLQYIKIPNSMKPGMARFTDEQKSDVFRCCSTIPNIQVQMKLFVLGVGEHEEEKGKIYEGDLCTVTAVLTRNNLNDGEKANMVHAPHLPYFIEEAWWIIFCEKGGKIMSMEKVQRLDKVIEHKIEFAAPKQGDHLFEFHVLSNAYVGLDVRKSLQLTTLPLSDLVDQGIPAEDVDDEYDDFSLWGEDPSRKDIPKDKKT